MEAERGGGTERLVFFSDAVVAIAMTLLVLPLIEIPRGVHDTAALLADRWPEYLDFAISFFVIARLWWSHHGVFEHVVRWNVPLVVTDVLWLFTIVSFPVATALNTSGGARDRLALGVYLGVMTVCSAFLTAMSLIIRRSPVLTDGGDDRALRRLVGSANTTGVFAVALVLAVCFPRIGPWFLLLLLLSGVLDRTVMRIVQRRAAPAV